MNSILLVGKTTFKEILRDRILYGLLAVSILMMGFAIAMAQLGFAEQAKITMDFTVFVLNISSVVISIFLGAQLLFREIENKTLLTLLTHPVSRTKFLLGKIIGLVFVLLVLYILFYFILLGQSSFFGYGNVQQISLVLFGLFLEALIILNLTIFLSCFLKTYLVVTISVILFIVGHWVESLRQLAENGKDPGLMSIYNFFKYSIPNFELMNWKSIFTGAIEVSQLYFFKVTLYSLGWSLFLFILAILIFRRRDIS